MVEQTDPIHLIHLAHFIEASFGLCIAFTIIDDVHQWGQKMCETLRKKQSEKWDKTKQQDKTVWNAKVILEDDENTFTENMAPKISILKIITFVIGIWFYYLLAFAGTHPGTAWPILPVCFFIYLPATVPLCFIAWIVSRWNNFYNDFRKKAAAFDQITVAPKTD
jgi:hypothetical protein